MMPDGCSPILFEDLGTRPLYESWTDERVETPAGTVTCLNAGDRHCDTTLAIEFLNERLGLKIDFLSDDQPPMDCPVFGVFAMMVVRRWEWDPLETAFAPDARDVAEFAREYLRPSPPPPPAPTEAPPMHAPQALEDEEEPFTPPPVIDPLRWGDEEPPPRRWMVDQWIPWRHVTGLYGPPGNGKSLLAQMLLTACTLGQPWLGMTTARVKAFGLFCEDEHDELWRRQCQINRSFQCSNFDLENMKLCSLHGLPSMLMDFGNGGLDATRLYEWLLDEVTDFGAQLVVVDTAAATFGGDENNRAQVTRYLNEILARLAHEIDGAVVLCAHPSKSSEYSGSTAWDASFRSRLNLVRYPDEDEEFGGASEELNRLRILKKQKANYAGVGDEIVLEYHDGYFRVQGTDDGTLARIEKNARHRRAEEAFLACLDELQNQGRNVSHHPHAGNYAPKMMRRLDAGRGFTKQDLTAAMEGLLKTRKILADQPIRTGPDRKPRHGLKRVEGGGE